MYARYRPGRFGGKLASSSDQMTPQSILEEIQCITVMNDRKNIRLGLESMLIFHILETVVREKWAFRLMTSKLSGFWQESKGQ